MNKLSVLCFCVVMSVIHGQSWVDNLSTLGDRIKAQVNSDMQDLKHNLHGLVNEITAQVHTNLEPIRALKLNKNIKNGIGGVTIVIEKPGGRTFIVRNHQKYSCTGTINLLNGQCDGSVTPFKISPDSKTDWCFVSNFNQVKDQLCLGTGWINLDFFNGKLGKVECKAVNGQAMLISLDEYKKLCQDLYSSTEYRYIPDLNSPDHVAIPNDNQYVKCDNDEVNLCVFTEDNHVLSNIAKQVYLVNNAQYINK